MDTGHTSINPYNLFPDTQGKLDAILKLCDPFTAWFQNESGIWYTITKNTKDEYNVWKVDDLALCAESFGRLLDFIHDTECFDPKLPMNNNPGLFDG